MASEAQAAMAFSSFKVDCSSYEKWLQSTGNTDSPMSALAYDMQLWQIRGEAITFRKVRALLPLLRNPVATDLLQWRYKPLNLNILQFSLICGIKVDMKYQEKHGFYNPEHYRGDGITAPREMLLNHPVHLAKFLGLTDVLVRSLDLLPWRKGYVYLPEVDVTPPNTIVYSNPKKVMVTPSSVAAALPNPKDLLLPALEEVEQHPEKATTSTIECIWDMACSNPDLCTTLLEDRARTHAPNKNITLLHCQIHMAQNWKCLEHAIEHSSISSSLLKHISRITELLSRENLADVKDKVQSFVLKNNRYVILNPYTCYSRRYASLSFTIDKAKDLLEALEAEQRRQRSLQQMCLPLVLHHALGNLSGLVEMAPPRLLRQFHIPFLDLYLKLKAESG